MTESRKARAEIERADTQTRTTNRCCDASAGPACHSPALQSSGASVLLERELPVSRSRVYLRLKFCSSRFSSVDSAHFRHSAVLAASHTRDYRQLPGCILPPRRRHENRSRKCAATCGSTTSSVTMMTARYTQTPTNQN